MLSTFLLSSGQRERGRGDGRRPTRPKSHREERPRPPRVASIGHPVGALVGFLPFH